MRLGQHQEAFLVSLLMALSLGIAVGYFFPRLPFMPVLLVLSGLAAWSAWSVFRSSIQAWPAFFLAAFFLGLLRVQAGLLLPLDDISRFAGEELEVTGRLAEEAQVKERGDGSASVRYCLQSETVRLAGGEEQKVSGRLYVYARPGGDGTSALPKIGDELAAHGLLRLPHGFHNPGQINTELLLRSQGITAVLLAGKNGVEAKEPENGDVPAWTRLLRHMAAVRGHCLSSMEAAMPKKDAAAIFAMLFGGYQGLDPNLLEAFTATGIVHILSVSGSHISLLAAVMAWLGALLRLPSAARVALVISTIAAYSMLAGMVPPVIRSALMGGLSFLALALDREKDARRLLLLTGLLMLAASPILLFHISFQLSFGATAGLLYVAPVARDWLQAHRVPSPLSAGIAITLGAHASTMPIVAWYFNQLSLSSFLANLVIVPMVELIIVVGIAAGLIAFAMPLAGTVAYAGDSLLLGIVYELARWMASLPGSQIWIPSLDWRSVLLYYAMLSVTVLEEPWRQKATAALWAQRRRLLLISALILAFGVGHRWSQGDNITLAAIDCGQGDAIVLRTAHGKTVLFDCGGERGGNEPGAFNTGERVIVPYLRHYGVNRVEAVFLTHAHADHAGGAGAVLKRMSVGSVYTADEGREAYAQSMGLGSGSPLLKKLRPVQEGEVFALDGVRIEVVYAPQLAAKGDGSGNEASNVYRVVYGNASFLITGDLTKENEKVLLERGRNLRCTVLKVGHHGSDTSTSEEFLQAVKPGYAVISVGANNGFGHPRAEVLERLREVGAKILRTDQRGEIKFSTDGRRMHVETYVHDTGKI